MAVIVVGLASGACTGKDPVGGDGAIVAALEVDEPCQRVARMDMGKRSHCAWRGLCAFDDATGRCEARSDAHCAQAAVCKEDGKCVVGLFNHCVVSNAGCRASEVCTERGHCGKNGDHDRCGATSETDCRDSAMCRTDGRCTLSPSDKYSYGSCLPGTDRDCRRSERCRKAGLCSKVADECRAQTAADCRESEDCKSRGACSLLAGEGRCVTFAATSDADCRGHELCRRWGWCFYNGTGRCVAKTDEACSASEGCKALGNCGFDGTAEDCGPTQDVHCQKANICEPYCVASRTAQGARRCLAPSSDACNAARACGKETCVLVDGRCIADNDPDLPTIRDVIRRLGN